ncbi:hypothetical protein ACRALDRAFT_1072723 [Sodiomyces alcalophilus JCM 7366]|uniref:uncharacterized protein n=1 Tax=Sodiomyces alcalophilus JCM 7366 TaxID=591952 RepID=UPI0039B562CF
MVTALSQDERQQYLGEVIDFFNSSQTTRAAFDAGRNYHRARVVHNQPASWPNLDELDERIELAKQFQDTIRAESSDFKDSNTLLSFRLNLIQFSTFLCADLENLRTIITDPISSPIGFYYDIQNVESFVAKCIQRGDTKEVVPVLGDMNFPSIDPAQVDQLPRSSMTLGSASRTSTRPKRKKVTISYDHGTNGSGNDDTQDDDGGVHEKKDPTYQPRLRVDGSVARNRTAADRARQRDGGLCVVSKSVEPDMCHIWPFASTARTTRRNSLRRTLSGVALLFSPTLRRELTGLLAPDSGEMAHSDQEFNRIALNPMIHRFWSKVFFGFKLVNATHWKVDPVQSKTAGKRKVTDEEEEPKEYSAFHVEWHWLPESMYDSLQDYLIRPEGEELDCRMVLDLGQEEVVQSVKKSLRNSHRPPSLISTKGATVRDENGHLIESGRIVTLTVKTKDLEKMQLLIQANWLASQIAAISGAAEVVDQLDPDPPRVALMEPRDIFFLGRPESRQESREGTPPSEPSEDTPPSEDQRNA